MKTRVFYVEDNIHELVYVFSVSLVLLSSCVSLSLFLLGFMHAGSQPKIDE